MKKSKRQIRRHRHQKKSGKVLKARFRRSNNQKLLSRSGFIDLRAYGPDIMDKYAPNDRRAIVPKNVNVKDVMWIKGHALQKNPPTYVYNAKRHGWVKL